MPKIPSKLSTILSLVLAILFLVGLVALAIGMPRLVRTLVELHDSIDGYAPVSPAGHTLLLILAYVGVAIVALADAILLLLLHSIRDGRVFTPYCVALLRSLSWCLIAFGGVFFAIGFVFRLAFIMAFVCVFIGICLRVVKNAFEEAVAIKEENELTI